MSVKDSPRSVCSVVKPVVTATGMPREGVDHSSMLSVVSCSVDCSVVSNLFKSSSDVVEGNAGPLDTRDTSSVVSPLSVTRCPSVDPRLVVSSDCRVVVTVPSSVFSVEKMSSVVMSSALVDPSAVTAHSEPVVGGRNVVAFSDGFAFSALMLGICSVVVSSLKSEAIFEIGGEGVVPVKGVVTASSSPRGLCSVGDCGKVLSVVNDCSASVVSNEVASVVMDTSVN